MDDPFQDIIDHLSTVEDVDTFLAGVLAVVEWFMDGPDSDPPKSDALDKAV